MFRQNAITFHFSFYSETKHSYTNHTSEMEKPICCVIFIYIYISTTCAMCTCSGTIKTGLMFVILYNSDIIIWSIVNRVPMVPYCEK